MNPDGRSGRGLRDGRSGERCGAGARGFGSQAPLDHVHELIDGEEFHRDRGQGIAGWVKIASIGPITSATVREHGLAVDVEAEPHAIEGLVAAIGQQR